MQLDQLTTDYLPIVILLAVSTFLGCLIVTLGHIVGPRRDTKLKAMPYESGMNPVGPAVRRMPVRFYLVAVLFILFDIEVVFFLPWAVVFNQFVKNGLGVFSLIEMFVFIGVLLIGYAYAWKTDSFEWQ
jgi:NADH-quinone oxidoreductase subunit A